MSMSELSEIQEAVRTTRVPLANFPIQWGPNKGKRKTLLATLQGRFLVEVDGKPITRENVGDESPCITEEQGGFQSVETAYECFRNAA